MQSLAGGAKRITYRIGPFNVVPGQNSIGYAPITQRPQVDGYITRIKPNLTYLDGTRAAGRRHPPAPRGVGEHLAARTTRASAPSCSSPRARRRRSLQLPKGYGYPLRRTDNLVLNHMIHNLTPMPDAGLHDLPDRLRAEGLARRARHPAGAADLDGRASAVSLYPVFNVRKGSGRNGRFTYPDDAQNPYGGGPKRNQWVVDRPGVLVATGGHLHPGGLHTDLKVRRHGRTVAAVPLEREVLRARGRRVLGRRDDRHAAGLEGEGPEGRRALGQRDLRHAGARSWWESMGIMVTYMADGGPGKNPFKQKLDRRGRVTHGHLPENNNHGGGTDASLPGPAHAPGRHRQSRLRGPRELPLPARAT